ncbi:hypothetical protein EBR78_04130, partial [bacterium]|nr:hypothetical protein [bacterium]
FNACDGDPSADTYKSVLESFESLDAEAKKTAEEKMRELAQKLEKKIQEEINKALKEEPPEEIAKRVEEILKGAELLGSQKTEELKTELTKSDLGQTFLRHRHKDVEESIKLARNGDQTALRQAQERLKLAEKMPLSSDQQKAVAGLNLTLDRALSGHTLGGGWGTFVADGVNATAHYFSGQSALPEIPTTPSLGKSSGGSGTGGSGSGSGSAAAPRSSSSSSTTPSHSQDSGPSGSASPSAESSSSSASTSSSTPSGTASPGTSSPGPSGSGAASAVTPSATPSPVTPTPAPATRGQTPSDTLANNAVSGSGRGTAPTPTTQPHGTGISKNPPMETGDNKKPATGRSNPDSDVGPIQRNTAGTSSTMPITGILAAGTDPRNRRESLARTPVPENPSTIAGQQNPKSGNREGDPTRPTNVYSSRDALRPGTTGEGLTKTTIQPTSSVKIADNADTASTDYNSGTPVTPANPQGKPSYNIGENGRVRELLATNDLAIEKLRVNSLGTGSISLAATDTTGSPSAALTIEGKNDSKKGNTPTGQGITLYGGEDQAPAQKALMASALSTKPTTGLASFAANTTGIKMPSITDDSSTEGTTARGLLAAQPNSKKTGVQAPKRSIAAVTPKASTGFAVQGFREFQRLRRGLLGAR